MPAVIEPTLFRSYEEDERGFRDTAMRTHSELPEPLFLCRGTANALSYHTTDMMVSSAIRYLLRHYMRKQNNRLTPRQE